MLPRTGYTEVKGRIAKKDKTTEETERERRYSGKKGSSKWNDSAEKQIINKVRKKIVGQITQDPRDPYLSIPRPL